MRAAEARTAWRRLLDLLEGDTAHGPVPAGGPPAPPGVWRSMVLAALSARPAALLQTGVGVTPGEAAAFGAGVRTALDAVVLAMDAEATRGRTWAAPADGPKANAPAVLLSGPAPGVEPGRLVVVDGDGAGVAEFAAGRWELVHAWAHARVHEPGTRLPVEILDVTARRSWKITPESCDMVLWLTVPHDADEPPCPLVPPGILPPDLGGGW
ncbi:hypothetical protein [Candidatus Protofrankia californiensis]|uniref:hypothetical protein n=1 Tax=Candidatus Protofrankia californiensis TaxID=1839754 RepID=UPI0010414A88|nr:hypothetical protein [Candidatus Protofrankia californiensis]